MIDVAYSPAYLNWILGPDHPTNPQRARICLELLEKRLPLRVVEPVASSVESLSLVHDPGYVARTLAGSNEEWSGTRPDLGATAALMCGGTEVLARRILAGETRFGFNPQGAKHHAQLAAGSGFCVFNDMALASRLFVDVGWRVAYIDIDAHHGDGVEALLRDVPQALTASVHGSPLWPGTGLTSDEESAALSWPVAADVEDDAWLLAVREAAEAVREWQPDVVLGAIGADAHETDPLTSMRVTEDGYAEAGRVIGGVVADLGVPVLIGGAGGYQPLTVTPQIWASVVTEISLVQPSVENPSTQAVR